MNDDIYETNAYIMDTLRPKPSAIIPVGISRTFLAISRIEKSVPISRKLKPISLKKSIIKCQRNIGEKYHFLNIKKIM